MAARARTAARASAPRRPTESRGTSSGRATVEPLTLLCSLLLLVLLFLLFGLPSSAFAQRPAADLATVRGVVVDSAGEPLDGVLVTVRRHGRDASTELGTFSERSTGGFRLELPRGRWRLEFNRIGYRPTSVRVVIRSSDPTPHLHVRLRASSLRMTPVSLTIATALTALVAGEP